VKNKILLAKIDLMELRPCGIIEIYVCVLMFSLNINITDGFTVT